MDAPSGSGNVRQAVPFLAVGDIGASRRFYEDGLGFRIAHKWVVEDEVRWCWLDRGGGSLMLQQFPPEGHDSWRPEGKVGEGVRICFMCDDALALYREFQDRGLEPKRPYVGNGLWVTSLADPDGYQLDFESPTDVPEDSEYREP